MYICIYMELLQSFKDETASTVRYYLQRGLNKPLLEAYYPFPLIKIHVMHRLLFSRFS